MKIKEALGEVLENSHLNQQSAYDVAMEIMSGVEEGARVITGSDSN